MDSFQWDACFVTHLEMVDEQHHKSAWALHNEAHT